MDDVFKALADPTRRALLDALFLADGQTMQALCHRIPGMTRFGVMKHLTVLEDAGLVVARRAGRTKQHFLNPVPIQQVADRWISKYAQPFTRGLVDLQTDLERGERLTRKSRGMAITRHVYRIHIKAPIDTVWNALIDPSFTRRYFHGTAFDAPPQAGQPYRTSLPDGQGAVDGTIDELDAPHRLVMTWHTLYDAAMAAEPPSRVEWTLTEVGGGLTQVDLVHGDLARSPITWASVRHGWVWIIDALKTLLETGDDLPAPTVTTPVIEDAAGEWHRAQGIECNNSTWEMIEAERTPANDEEMLRRAYASAYHWQRAARTGPENEARALYMLAKAHLLAGHPDASLRYADSCMAQCQQHGLVDFDLAYAHEARSRALHALGRTDEAAESWSAAKAVPIADAEDQAILDADLAVAL